jgi:hypothetical protein
MSVCTPAAESELIHALCMPGGKVDRARRAMEAIERSDGYRQDKQDHTDHAPGVSCSTVISSRTRPLRADPAVQMRQGHLQPMTQAH